MKLSYFAIAAATLLFASAVSSEEYLSSGIYKSADGLLSTIKISRTINEASPGFIQVDQQPPCMGNQKIPLTEAAYSLIRASNGACTIEAIPATSDLDHSYIKIRTVGCASFSQLGCSIDGAYWHSEHLKSASTAPTPKQLKNKTTSISSSNHGDKIIVNNDFVGKGSVIIDISEYADTKIDLKGILRADSKIEISAIPINRGCRATITLYKDDRIPKNLALDTSLCPIRPSIEVNLSR